MWRCLSYPSPWCMRGSCNSPVGEYRTCSPPVCFYRSVRCQWGIRSIWEMKMFLEWCYQSVAKSKIRYTVTRWNHPVKLPWWIPPVKKNKIIEHGYSTNISQFTLSPSPVYLVRVLSVPDRLFIKNISRRLSRFLSIGFIFHEIYHC